VLVGDKVANENQATLLAGWRERGNNTHNIASIVGFLCHWVVIIEEHFHSSYNVSAMLQSRRLKGFVTT